MEGSCRATTTEQKAAMTSGGQPLAALERRRGTKGLARRIGAPVSLRGTHGALPQGGLRLALGLILECVPANLARCQCSTSLGPGSRAGLSRRWHARSRCHGQEQRVRAGEPVEALSRDAQAPPFNVQASCVNESEESTVRASPGDALWRDPAGSSQKE